MDTKQIRELMEGLNKEQAQAVNTQSRRVLCLAGAGTGKTRTLTARVARLNEERVGTSSMLALTFTRLAGQEMKKKIIKLIGSSGENLFCNTFHALATKVLKEEGYRIGIDPGYTIYDPEDRAAIFKNIISNWSLSISLKKANQIYAGGAPLPEKAKEQRAYINLINEYNFLKTHNNAVDISELIIKANILFEHFPAIPYELHKQYKYIFIDEYQDTNKEQETFINYLQPENLFIVGDDYQAIYEWRNAKPELIIDISKKAPANNYEIIKLETNYRSTSKILNIANKIIKKNENKTDKTLKAFIEQKNEEAAEFLEFETLTEEMEWIIKKIKEKPTENTAILCRKNLQVRYITNYLRTNGIDAQAISKEADVMHKPHIKELIKILQLAQNPADDYLLKKVINSFAEVPRIRADALRVAEIKAIETEESIYEVISRRSQSERLMRFIETLRRTTGEESAGDAMNLLIEELNIEYKYSQAQLTNRIEDISKMRYEIAKWEARQLKIGEPISVGAYIIYLQIKDIQAGLEDEETKDIKVMTVHTSKGLEFSRVFIPMMNAGDFPVQRGSLEEERRLFFVAITRAEQELYITRAKEKITFYNNPRATKESIFFKEGKE